MLEEKKEEIVVSESKPSSYKKIIGFVLLVLVITAVMVVIFTNIGDFSKTWDAITSMDYRYLLIGIGLVVLYLLSWPISLMILTRRKKDEVKPADNFLIGGSEHFFNAITPFASGGQPIQIYLYTQNGMKAAEATGIVISNFIAFMIATNAYALVSLIFFKDFTSVMNPNLIWIIIVGFVMNLLTLFFIMALALSKRLRNLFVKLFKALGKIKFLTKIIDKTLPKFEEYCNNMQLASKEIISHKLDFVLAIISRAISVVFYYAIPFFILLGLGVELEFSNLFYVILASSFTITAMVWVPTPGGMGGIEFAFTWIFAIFFANSVDKAAIVTASMIIWRFLTYYLLMFLSGIEYVIYEIIIKRRKKKEIADNND